MHIEGAVTGPSLATRLLWRLSAVPIGVPRLLAPDISTHSDRGWLDVPPADPETGTTQENPQIQGLGAVSCRTACRVPRPPLSVRP